MRKISTTMAMHFAFGLDCRHRWKEDNTEITREYLTGRESVLTLGDTSISVRYSRSKCSYYLFGNRIAWYETNNSKMIHPINYSSFTYYQYRNGQSNHIQLKPNMTELLHWTMAGHNTTTTRDRLAALGIVIRSRNGEPQLLQADGSWQPIDPNAVYTKPLHVVAKDVHRIFMENRHRFEWRYYGVESELNRCTLNASRIQK